MKFPLYFYLIIWDLVPIALFWLLWGLFLLCFLKDTVHEVIFTFLELIYSKTFNTPEQKGYKEEKEDRYKLDSRGYKWLILKSNIHVPGILSGMLVFLVYCVVATAFAVFWDTTFIQSKVDNCVIGEEFDCFTKNSRLNSKPLDCRLKNYNDSDTVCYKLAWNIGEGLADAGGILTMSSAVLTGSAVVVLNAKLYLGKCLECCKCCKRSKRTRQNIVISVLLGFQLILLLGVSAGLLSLLMLPYLWNLVRSNTAMLMKTLSVLFTLYSMGWLPWYFCYIVDSDDEKSKNEKKNESKKLSQVA